MLPLLLAVTFLFSTMPIPALAEGEAPADTDWAAMYGPGECLVFADFVPGADLIVGSSTHGVQLYLRQTGTTEVQPISLTVTGSLPTHFSTDSDAVLYGAEGAEVFALSSPNAITPGAGGGQQIELQATKPGETVEPNASVMIGIVEQAHHVSISETVLHEMGHALGWLGHSDMPTAVMYGYPTATALTSVDIRHILQIYDRFN